jgi:uncharacterized protein involved in outer membrane biogenesis
VGPLKVFAAVLAATALLLVAAAALIAWRFDPNDYKSYLTSWAEQRTGRTLVVEDDLELRFFPWLAVETGGLTLGNAEGFDMSEPFAAVERLAAEVKLLPLLSRRVEIGSIRLDGLRLNLARNADGRGNWEDLAGAEPAGGDPDADGGAGAWADSLDVAGVRIRDAVVYWRENTDQLRYVASGIALETGDIGPGRPIDVSLIVDVLDVDSQRTFEVQSRSSVLLGGAPATAEDAAEAFELRDFGLRLRVVDGGGTALAEGGLDATSVRAAGDGRIEVGGARLTSRLPGGTDAAARWSRLVFDPGSGSLTTDALVTSVAGVDAAWQLTGRNLIDTPRIDGSINIVSGSIAGALDALGLEPPQGLDRQSLGTLDADVAFDVTLAPGGGTADVEIGPYRLAALKLDIANARALGIGLSAEAELVDGALLEGRVDVPAFTPNEALIALARANAPATLDVAALDRVALSGAFETDLTTMRTALRDARIETLGASVTGTLDVLPETGGAVYRGTVATSRIDPDRLARFLGDALPAAITPDKLGALALDTRFDYDTRTDRATLDAMSLEAFGLAATGRATIDGVSGTPAATGEARVATFSPRDLMRRFGQAVPDTSDDSVLRRAGITTRFAVDTTRGRFTNLELALDDTRITGDFAVTSFEDIGYSFTLAIDRVDADRYLPPRSMDLPDDAPEDTPIAGDIELPADALHNIKLNGRVSVGQLRLAGLDFQDVATGIETGDGQGKLDSASAKLYGGEFAGSFHVQAAGEEPGLTLTGKATNLTLEPMIIALTGDANFSGSGDFDLRLTGRGARIIDNVHSANGDVSFALRSGAIDGFNLGRTLCAVYNATQRVAAPPEQPRSTAYELISGSATVRNGVASSPNLLARTSFMDVNGTGSLVLAEQRLDYDLEAKMTGSVGIPGCESMDGLIGESIPLTLRGTVTDPEIRPDFSEIIERRLRNEVQDRLRERVQDRLRDLLR